MIDANTEEFNDGGWGKTGFGRKVASIPLNVLNDWHSQGLRMNDHEGIKRRLNDSDYRKLRTRPGRI